jgi:hypothetical protein
VRAPRPRALTELTRSWSAMGGQDAGRCTRRVHGVVVRGARGKLPRSTKPASGLWTLGPRGPWTVLGHIVVDRRKCFSVLAVLMLDTKTSV